MDLPTFLTIIGTLATPVTLLIYRAMRLRLIRHIYDEGGARDAVAVIKAMKVLSPAVNGTSDQAAGKQRAT